MSATRAGISKSAKTSLRATDSFLWSPAEYEAAVFVPAAILTPHAGCP